MAMAREGFATLTLSVVATALVGLGACGSENEDSGGKAGSSATGGKSASGGTGTGGSSTSGGSGGVSAGGSGGTGGTGGATGSGGSTGGTGGGGSCVRATRLWFEDWETGDYSRWTSQSYDSNWGNGCQSNALSTGQAQSPTYSHRSEITCAYTESHRGYGGLQFDGDTVCQWHWGAYASGNNDDVVLFEDDNSICKLEEPWTDFVTEPWLGNAQPVCP